MVCDCVGKSTYLVIGDLGEVALATTYHKIVAVDHMKSDSCEGVRPDWVSRHYSRPSILINFPEVVGPRDSNVVGKKSVPSDLVLG